MFFAPHNNRTTKMTFLMSGADLTGVSVAALMSAKRTRSCDPDGLCGYVHLCRGVVYVDVDFDDRVHFISVALDRDLAEFFIDIPGFNRVRRESF